MFHHRKAQLKSRFGPQGARPRRAQPHIAAPDESDRRIEDHLVARFDSGAHFHLRAQIARHYHLANFHLAMVDDRDLQAVAVEDDGLGGALSCLDVAR